MKADDLPANCDFPDSEMPEVQSEGVGDVEVEVRAAMALVAAPAAATLLGGEAGKSTEEEGGDSTTNWLFWMYPTTVAA